MISIVTNIKSKNSHVRKQIDILCTCVFTVAIITVDKIGVDELKVDKKGVDELGVDELKVDKKGVDELGVDEMETHLTREFRGRDERV